MKKIVLLLCRTRVGWRFFWPSTSRASQQPQNASRRSSQQPRARLVRPRRLSEMGICVLGDTE